MAVWPVAVLRTGAFVLVPRRSRGIQASDTDKDEEDVEALLPGQVFSEERTANKDASCGTSARPRCISDAQGHAPKGKREDGETESVSSTNTSIPIFGAIRRHFHADSRKYFENDGDGQE